MEPEPHVFWLRRSGSGLKYKTVHYSNKISQLLNLIKVKVNRIKHVYNNLKLLNLFFLNVEYLTD